jgi:hypothetical protein
MGHDDDDFDVFSCDLFAIKAVLLTISVLQLLSLLGLGIFVKRYRYLASKGNAKASELLVLPIYNLVFLYALACGFIVGLDNVTGYWVNSLYIFSVKWILIRTCAEGIAFFFMHSGVGYKALRRSLLSSLSWSVISTMIPIALYVLYGSTAFFVCALIFLSITLFFYLGLWLLPHNILIRRPAAVHYARFYSATMTSLIIAFSLIITGEGPCFVRVILVVVDLLQPFIILRALNEDSQFWQGK